MATRQLRISLASLTLPALSPTSLVDVAADTGFDSVGVNLLQVWRAVSADAEWFAAEVDILEAALKARNINMTHGGHLLLGGLDRKASEHILPAMRRLGAAYVVLVADPRANPIQIEDDFDFFLDYANTSGYANDVSMLVEFAPYAGWKGLADAMRFIEEHDAVPLKLVVDILHLMRSGSFPLLMSRDDWPVGLIQPCDAPLNGPPEYALQMEARGNRLDVGEGALPLTEIFSRLPRNIPLEIEAPCLALRNLTPHERARRSFVHLTDFLREHGFNEYLSQKETT